MLEEAACLSDYAFQQIVVKFYSVNRISLFLSNVQCSLQSQSNDELSLNCYRKQNSVTQVSHTHTKKSILFSGGK